MSFSRVLQKTISWMTKPTPHDNYKARICREVVNKYGIHPTLLPVLPLIPNIPGFSCQLSALSGVLEWMYAVDQIHGEPLSARKRYKKNSTLSLRKIAKQKYQSATGEINNICDLASLAEEHNEISTDIICANNYKEYSSAIMKAIDNAISPIIFYDVGIENGFKYAQPVQLKGDHEHAAAVVGYFTTPEKNLHFILSHWESYTLVKAEELYQSSVQLLSQRESRVYFKTKDRYNEGAWIIKRKEYLDRFTSNSKVVNETSPTDGGVAGKILCIKPKPDPMPQNNDQDKVQMNIPKLHSIVHRSIRKLGTDNNIVNLISDYAGYSKVTLFASPVLRNQSESKENNLDPTLIKMIKSM